MINVIHGVGANAFDTLAYPEQMPINQNFIQTRLQNFSETLTQVGQEFMDNARQVYEQINNSEAMQFARLAIRSAKGLFKSNQIVPLNTLEDFQVAQPIMQRWVMANPEIRTLYHAQKCDGYSDTYVDMYPGVIGEEHYDYRRVMDGVIMHSDEGKDWTATFYMDDLVEGDRDVTFQEKTDIISCWDLLEIYIKNEQDPTNIYTGRF